MQKIIYRLPLATICLLTAMQAHAVVAVPQILSFSDFVNSSFGPGGVTSTSSSGQQSVSSTSFSEINAVETYRQVTTPSTSSVQGSVDIFKDVNRTRSETTYAYKYDQANYSVSVTTPTQSAGQYIELTGTVSTTSDTYLSFSLASTGSFSSTTDLRFGSIGPTMPLLGFGSGGTNGIATNLTVSTANSTFYEQGYVSIFLNAGNSYAFNAFVYSSSAAVALNDFSLGIQSSAYDAITTTDNFTYPTFSILVSSVTLPLAAAVPEPETYAMLLAGLALIGTIARRRKIK